MDYIAPDFNKAKFTCPHCGTIALHNHQSGSDNLGSHSSGGGRVRGHPINTAICQNCGVPTIWYNASLIFPNRGNAPHPNSDMPDDVLSLYNEAAGISDRSPRGAAALLRLSIQKLAEDLGGKGENINDDIAKLVKDGLPVKIQQALDVVRVIGNNAVHPGQINADDPKIVGTLFMLVNLVTEHMISSPKKVEALFGELPDGAKEAIKKRDKKSPKGESSG